MVLEIIHKLLKMHVTLSSVQWNFLDILLPIVQFTWYHSFHSTYVDNFQSFDTSTADV